MYAIFAPVDVNPDCVDDFIAASKLNAQSSLAEPGCLQFELLRDAARETRLYFYEVYADESAFNAHEAAPHYAAWVKATCAMIDAELEMVVMSKL